MPSARELPGHILIEAVDLVESNRTEFVAAPSIVTDPLKFPLARGVIESVRSEVGF